VIAVRNLGNLFGPKDDAYRVEAFQLTQAIFKPRHHALSPGNTGSAARNASMVSPRPNISSPRTLPPLKSSEARTDLILGSNGETKSTSPSIASPCSCHCSSNHSPPISLSNQDARHAPAIVDTHSTSNNPSFRWRSCIDASSSFPSITLGYESARPSSPQVDTRPTSNSPSMRTPLSSIASSNSLSHIRSGEGSNNSATSTMRPDFSSSNRLPPIRSNGESEDSDPGSKRDGKRGRLELN
jgi:hypothetical protein